MREDRWLLPLQCPEVQTPLCPNNSNNKKCRIYQDMINKNYKPTQKDKHVTKNKKMAKTNNNQSE